MIENTKREDIIIQIGNEFIRVGLVGDKVPRKTLKSGSSFKYPSSPTDIDRFENGLEELLYNIFFSHINCSCIGKTVIILEKVFTDRRILEAMAKIMFKKLKVERMELSLSCVTPLYLTGKYSGIVISAGASSVEIMPVYQGYPIFSCFKSMPLGTLSLNKYIKDDLALLNKEVPIETVKSITDQELTDLKNQHGAAIGASANPIVITIKKIKFKFIPDKINYNIFYGNPQNQQVNIAYSLLDAISQLPSNCFDSVCRNVVLAGGFWRIKGMQKLFKKQIKQQLTKFKQLQTHGIKQKLGFVSWSFNPSDVAWIGCSIGASIRSVEHLSIKRSQYSEHGFTQKIMKSYFLSN